MTTRTYHGATGFLESETVAGTTTTFTPDGSGNVAWVENANGSWTEMTYTWGAVQTTATGEPGSLVTRVIDIDGTVRSETRGGRTTQFDYDALGRTRTMQPPGANAVETRYNDAAGTVTTWRGPLGSVRSEVIAYVDGFGRTVRRVDSTGVRTETDYDADGRPTFVSLPYGPGDPRVGTQTTYDALGRLRRETHADGTYREYTYGAGTVAIRDEASTEEVPRITTHTYRAFGHPDAAQLATLRDADGHDWHYHYTVTGALREVAGPDSVRRTWDYDPERQWLTAETHPESGTVTYAQYDPSGLLQQKVDAKGQVTTFTYDGSGRVKTITAGASQTTIDYEPGTDHRARTVVDGVSTESQFDATTGRLASRTVNRRRPCVHRRLRVDARSLVRTDT